MERYLPKNHREGIHPVVGDLYISSGLEDLLSYRSRIIEEYNSALGKWPLRAQAMLYSRDLMEERSTMTFVYVPNVKHQPEGRFAEGRTIHVYDDSAELPIKVPPRKFNLRRLRSGWKSDIVILCTFYEGRMPDTFNLSHFLNGSVNHPKRDLGIKILHG